MMPSWIRVWFFKYKPAIFFKGLLYVKDKKFSTSEEAYTTAWQDGYEMKSALELIEKGYLLKK